MHDHVHGGDVAGDDDKARRGVAGGRRGLLEGAFLNCLLAFLYAAVDGLEFGTYIFGQEPLALGQSGKYSSYKKMVVVEKFKNGSKK